MSSCRIRLPPIGSRARLAGFPPEQARSGQLGRGRTPRLLAASSVAASGATQAMTTDNLSRSEAEDFLYREAALLDSWRLMEWAELFTDDGEYLVPSTDEPDGDPASTLFLIYD